MQFCDKDSQGEQLSADAWRKISGMFDSPGTPHLDRISVVRDFVVSMPNLQGDKAEFYVEYIQVGTIDSTAVRFSRSPSVKLRTVFNLIKRSATEPRPAANGGGVRAEWSIEGPVPEPHLTVDGAIRYATELRKTARDAATRRSAAKMLLALNGLR